MDDLTLLDKEVLHGLLCEKDGCKAQAEYSIVKLCHNQVWLNCYDCTENLVDSFHIILEAFNKNNKVMSMTCKECGKETVAEELADMFDIQPLEG